MLFLVSRVRVTCVTCHEASQQLTQSHLSRCFASFILSFANFIASLNSSKSSNPSLSTSNSSKYFCNSVVCKWFMIQYLHTDNFISIISPSCSWSWTACTSTCRPSSSPARGTCRGATPSPPCSPFCWRRCPGSRPPCRICGGGRGRRFCHSPSPSWLSSPPPGYPQWCPAVITWRTQVISGFAVYLVNAEAITKNSSSSTWSSPLLSSSNSSWSLLFTWQNGNIFRIFLEYLFYCHCATWNGIILHPIRREHVHCLVHFMQNYIFATFMQICRIMDVYLIMLPKYFVRFLPPRPWCVPRRIWCQFLRHHLYQFCCKFPKIKDKVLKLKTLWETGNWGKVESF